LHVQVARHLDVVAAHRVTHWVIDAIKQHLPGVTDVVVHTEPAGIGQPFNPMPEEILSADGVSVTPEAKK
jgi:divalent metal cation (Fe/Co/Zn/Cd) transporter